MVTTKCIVLNFNYKLMKTTELIQKIENYQLKQDLPTIHVGDIARIGTIIQEGNKQRVQTYEGTVIAKMNTGINTAIMVRRIFQGISIERIFVQNLNYNHRYELGNGYTVCPRSLDPFNIVIYLYI